MVGISKYVFTVDIPTVRNSAAPDGFDMEEPVCCSVKEVIEGVCCIIEHDGNITDIATSQCGLSVSASKDGTIRLWKDHNSSSLIPHRGQEVCAVALLSASHHPDHIILLSAGPLNRELRLWVPLTKEGWLPPSGQCNWKCIQTLELTSSGGNVEDEFFNQVLVVPRSNIILLANAKKSALYVVHVDFGSSPADTRLDYLTEFSVMLPILSFTATSENIANGDRFLQVYCVQTQAIQQYSLDLAQCLPPVGQYASESSLDSRVQLSTDMIANRVASYEAESIAADTMGTSSSAGTSFPANQSVPFGSCDMDLVGDSRVIGISTSDTMDSLTREIGVHVSKGSSPAPEVELTVRSPRGSPLTKMRVKSLDDFHVSTSRETLDYFSSFEQSGDPNDRPAASSIPSSPKQTIWEPPPSSSQRIHINNPFRMNEDKEWQPSSGMASVSEAQSNAGSSMHLITPSELMSMVTRTKIDVEEGPLRAPYGMDILKELMKPVSGCEASVAKGDFESLTVETKEMNETAKFLPDDVGPKKVVLLRRGVPGLDPRMRIFHAPIMDNTTGTSLSESAHRMQDVDSMMGEESVREDDQAASEEKEPLHTAPGDENIEQFHEASALVDGIQMLSVVPQTRRKKNKNKTDINVLMNPIISSSATMSNVTSISEQDSSRISSGVLPSKLPTQFIEMQDAVNQLLAMQRDFQKQLQLMQAVPVAKELKRVEVVIGQRMEKVLKAHMDALWARLQEDFSKREKVEREQMQHLSSFLSNYLNKDLVSALERALKKELSTIGSSVARLVAPNVDKSITMAVMEAFQKGINEKGVTQIEKSIGAKIEASMSRQLHSQFQTTGKVALQEALRSSLEVSVIPAFERSCQSMFAQVDAAFQKGLFDTQAQTQQFLASSGITSALQEAVTSATSLAASLKGELADGHRRLLAVIEGTGVSHGPYTVNGALPDKVMTVQHVEESLDPTKELTRLLAERKYEEAFDKALSLTDVGVVSWLCNQVDLQAILTTTPLPLSQGVLLALIQQLGFDLRNDTGKKLGWIKDAALALNPMDPGLPPHVMRHILEKLYNNLHGLLTTSISADLMFSTRLMIHVVNSLLTACK
ncbi:hypothetical protein KP509_33G025800 [Ceratopteris richardii]|nr:hypothetical protein KP509_33G025800 [Ceratopteris richardii]